MFKNPAVSDIYEPGSTFKILTYASAIDAGAVTPDTTFNCTGHDSRSTAGPIYNSTQRRTARSR